MNQYKYTILLLLFCIFTPINLSAQSIKIKPERRIYLLDVTLSMHGFGGKPDIYDEVINALISDIEKINNDETEIIVMPFQETILEVWSVNATDKGREEIIKRIKNYNNTTVTGTNIALPLKEVIDKYISDCKRNILVLLTDGLQNQGTEKELYNQIDRWCSITDKNDAYAFYVMLTKYAKNDELLKKIDEACQFEAILIDKLSDGIAPIDIRLQDKLFYNIKEDGDKINLKFDCAKNIELPKDLEISVSGESEFIEFANMAKVENGVFEIEVRLKKELDSLKQILPVDRNSVVELCVDIKNKDEYPLIKILNNNLSLELINKPENVLKIAEKFKNNRSKIWGETSYYKDFPLCKYKPNIMTKTLQFEFNNDAVKYGKEVQFAIYTKNDKEECVLMSCDDAKLYVNDTLVKGENIFAISNKIDEQDVSLGIEFMPDAKEESHNIYLKVLDAGKLNRINESEIQLEAKPILMEWTAKKKNIINPLLFWLIFITVVILILFIIYCVIIRVQITTFRKFKSISLIVGGGMMSYGIRSGISKVVFSNIPIKQTIWQRFSQGSCIFVQNPFFLNGNITVTPTTRAGRARVRVAGNAYTINNTMVDIGNPTSLIVIVTNSAKSQAQLIFK